MNNWRLQSSTGRVLFKAYLSSDHLSPATGKTIAIVLSKNGAAFANPNAGASNATEIANGWYYFAPAAQDRDTLGPVVWRGTEGTIDPTETEEFIVDAVRAGLTALPNAAAEAAGGLYTRGSGAGQINQDANGRADVRLVHIPTALTLDAGTIAALGIVDNGTAQSVPDTTHTQLRAAAAFGDGALRGKTLYIVSATTGAGQSVQITNNVGATDTVEHEAFPIALTGTVTYIVFASPPTPAAVANGSGLTAVPWNSAWDAEVQSEAADALNAYDPPTRAELTTDTNSVLSAVDAVPTAGENADAVWDEAIAGHLGAGSTGNALNAAGSAGDPWATPIPGAYGAGTAGKILGDNVNATIGSRASQASVDDVPTAAEIVTALLATSIHGQTIENLLSGGGSFNLTTSIDGATLTVRGHDGTTIFTRTLTRADFDAIRNSA